MSITREQVLETKAFSEVAKLLKEHPAEMQPLMRGDVLIHIQKLIDARNTQLTVQESEIDRQTALQNPPSTEQLAAEAAAVAAETPVVETPVVPTPVVPVAPDYSEEDAAWKAEGVVVSRNASGKIIRMHQEYQVTDEDGRPIGRPTSLIASSPLELVAKQRVAHENATRAFSRLKKQKLTFKQNEENRLLTPAEIKAAAEKALEAKDAAEAEKVVRSVLENDFKAKEEELQGARTYVEGQKIGNIFVRRHLHDFNPVEANFVAIGEYLKQHDMEFTLDNVEYAFQDLNAQGDKLAPLPSGSVATKPAEQTNTPVTATAAAAAAPELPAPPPAAAVTPTAVAQPAAVAASQPVVEATVTTPVAANTPTATRRPGVNGGIPPGSMSAHRPGAPDPAQARKEFMKELKDMSADTIRKKLNDPQFVKQLTTYGIKIR